MDLYQDFYVKLYTMQDTHFIYGWNECYVDAFFY